MLNRYVDTYAIYIVNRIRFGHSRTRAHIFSKGFMVQETCECGENKNLHTLEHLGPNL